MKVSNPKPSSVEGMLNCLREMTSESPAEELKIVWRGVVKKGSVLITPAGCCVGLSVKSTCVAIRRHFFPVSPKAAEDLDTIAQVAPTRVSSAYVNAMRKASAL